MTTSTAETALGSMVVPKLGCAGSVVFRHLVCDTHSHMFFAKSCEKHNLGESVTAPFSGVLMKSLVGELTNDFGSVAAGAAGVGSAEAMLKRLLHCFWTWLS